MRTPRPARLAGRVGLLFLLQCLLLVTPAAAQDRARPDVGAETAVVVDASSGAELYGRDPDASRPVASATKLMTALIALEEASPRDVFTASSYDALPVESVIGLRPGEQLTVRDLLAGLMLTSANDAAVTIAENVSGSTDAFVDRMNERARELGLENTSFSNPVGLDDPANFSSARDLATLARKLLEDRSFSALVDRPQAQLRTGSRDRTVVNRNRLVATHPFVDGVKTGYTMGAGYVLVGSATRGGARVVSVVLGEPTEAARETDTLALLRYGLAQFRRVRPVRAREEVVAAPIRFRDGESVGLLATEDVRLTLRRGTGIRRRVEAPKELEGPLPAGRRVGSVVVTDGDTVLARVPLVTARAVPEASAFRRAVGDGPGPAVTITIGLGVLTAAGLVLLRVRQVRTRREAAVARRRARGTRV